MVSRDTRSSTEYYINKNVEKKAKRTETFISRCTNSTRKEGNRAC